MRKVELTMTEQVIYEIVKDFVDHREERNFKRLCLKLQCSKRTAQRKIAGYNLYGKAYFRHKNHDRKPARTIPDEIRAAIISLYNTYYPTANWRRIGMTKPPVYWGNIKNTYRKRRNLLC